MPGQRYVFGQKHKQAYYLHIPRNKTRFASIAFLIESTSTIIILQLKLSTQCTFYVLYLLSSWLHLTFIQKKAVVYSDACLSRFWDDPPTGGLRFGGWPLGLGLGWVGVPNSAKRCAGGARPCLQLQASIKIIQFEHLRETATMKSGSVCTRHSCGLFTVNVNIQKKKLSDKRMSSASLRCFQQSTLKHNIYSSDNHRTDYAKLNALFGYFKKIIQ